MDLKRPTHPNDALRQARIQRGWSQAQVAERVGTNGFTVSRWELGQAVPGPYYRQQLAELFAQAPEALGLVPGQKPRVSPQPLWSVPTPRNHFFTGREAYLDRVAATLHTAGTAAVTQAISGLGGIGKTQLALEYCYRFRDQYQAIFWISAESWETVLADLGTLAVLLDLPERYEAYQERLVAAFKRWLEAHQQWLLVLDNVEDLALAHAVLPTTSRGQIVLTTRLQATRPLAEPLTLEPFPPEVGARFLLARAGLLALHDPLDRASGDLSEMAQTLAMTLDGLPLALDQAGAYLEETGCSLPTYLDLYQQAPLRLLRERHTGEPHPASVVRTFGLIAARLEQHDPAAAALAQVYAYLAPEAIPEEVILQGAAELGPLIEALVRDPFRTQAAYKELLSSSLVRRQAQAGTVTMHRLVQVVLREHLEEDQQRRWAECVVRLVNLAFPQGEFATWERCQRLLPHVLACVGHIERWHFTFPEGARLLHQAGYYLRQRARYAEALPLLQQALVMREHTLGPDHPEVAASLNHLAALFWYQGQYAEALPLYQRALAIREQALGPDHPDVAESLNNLALLHMVQGASEQALPLYQRALAIQEQAFGPTHPEMAASLNNLAQVYHLRGDHVQELVLNQRALAIREQALEPTHPDVAASLNNLAQVYHLQGQYEQALPLYQRALSIYEQVLGPDHARLAIPLNNLAELYQAQAQYQEALPLHQRARAIWERTLGPNHPYVACSLNNLAELSLAQGRYQEALPLAQRALAIREHKLGSDHPEVAESLRTLADLACVQGQGDQALALYERAVKINDQGRPDHPNTATCLEHLARLLRQLGQEDQAHPLEARAQAIRIRHG